MVKSLDETVVMISLYEEDMKTSSDPHAAVTRELFAFHSALTGDLKDDWDEVKQPGKTKSSD